MKKRQKVVLYKVRFELVTSQVTNRPVKMQQRGRERRSRKAAPQVLK